MKCKAFAALAAALTPVPTNNQVHALSSAVSGTESVTGARPAARNWSPSLDLQQNPAQGDSAAANGNASGTKSTSDVVARVKLIQRVSKAFQHLGPEGGSVRIRLAPAELGSIRVEMQVHDRRVRARVVAETESASTALREHLSDLRARLESYGMHVERLDVEVEQSDHGFDPRQDANSQWQSPQQNGSGNRFTTEPVPSTPTVSDPSGSTPQSLASIVQALNRGVDLQL